MQWCLESVADTQREWIVTIESSPFIIGRADDCHLKLVDKHISRHHSEIRSSGDLLWVRDLGSTNGTFVNQSRIINAQLLEPEDIISIGQYRFKLKSVSVSNHAAASETMCSTLSGSLSDLSTIEPKLRKLVQKREVNPHFQPLIRFADMNEIGYEILGRIENKDLPSNVSDLLDLAESLGYASQLSAVFREVGVERGRALPGAPLFFVNTTKLEVCELDTLEASLKKLRAIAPNKIVLEINEKAAADSNVFLQVRRILDQLDIGLAFDDFGVGQTRLVELAKMAPDYLKFDMSLIRKIHLAPKRLRQMVATFIKASHDLGCFALAEGIECFEEADVCEELGFDLGQGYLFGKPVPIDSITNDLEATLIFE